MTAALIHRAAPDRANSDTASLVPTTPATATPAAHPNREPDAIMSDPVTAADIAEFLQHLAALRVPARAEDPAERAEFLARKAELFGRIADQHTRSDPTYSQVAQPAADVNPALTPSPATPSPATP